MNENIPTTTVAWNLPATNNSQMTGKGGGNSIELYDNPDDETEILDEEAQKAYLDQMFDEEDAAKIRKLPKMNFGVADHVLKTKLKPHQKDGLRWLIAQETSQRPNPFYTEMTNANGMTVYRCVLTGKHKRDGPPNSFQGALLADGT